MRNSEVADEVGEKDHATLEKADQDGVPPRVVVRDFVAQASHDVVDLRRGDEDSPGLWVVGPIPAHARAAFTRTTRSVSGPMRPSSLVATPGTQ